MSRVIFILAFVALTFSLGVSASPKKDDKQDAEEATKNFLQTMKACNETFTIEKPFIQALNESGSFPDETERTPKCYVRCILEKMGAATEDGVYDPDLMSMLMAIIRPGSDSSDFGDITVKCNDRKETCKCDRAYQYVKCVIQEDIKKNSS